MNFCVRTFSVQYLSNQDKIFNLGNTVKTQKPGFFKKPGFSVPVSDRACPKS